MRPASYFSIIQLSNSRASKIAGLEQLALSFGLAAGAASLLTEYETGLKYIAADDSESRKQLGEYYLTKYYEQVKAQFGTINTTYTPPSSSPKGGKTKDPKTPSSSSAAESKTTINWIEKKLDSLQKKIDATKAAFENLFTVKSKAKNIDKQISQTKDLLKATEKAAKKYKKYADGIKLSSGLKKKVQSGDYNIKDYDSKTADKINQYEDYYSKYKDLKKQADELETQIRESKIEKNQLYVDAAEAKLEKSKAHGELDKGNYREQNKHLEAQKKYLKESYKYQVKIAELEKDSVKASQLKAELKKELRDLTKEEFDNVTAEYDNKVGAIEDRMKIVNSKMEQLEAKGYAAGSSYYNQLISQEEKNLAQLKEEWDVLQDQMERGLKEGTIKEGSAVWYEMVEAINEVENATIQASTSLIGYRNELRQLEWDAFDRVQDYISEIQNESGFLTDLIGNKKLFDDNGQWTEYADATAGLHAVNYNTYMSQADDYASEIEKINRELAADPYNTILISRRQELIRSQQEAVKSAEDEKEAIQNLVSDGYSVMIDALQKIVDKRKELLDSEKNLYDYEKKISKQAKDVLNLEKQKLALQGDNSEEAQARLQQITLKLDEARDDLEESEYAQWKTDQEQMLDSLTDNMQEWVNQRLDNIDGLVSEVITSTNANASTIKATLEQTGKEVGYTLTDEMERIWDTNNSIVSSYGDSFGSQLTSVNTILTEIRNFVSAMQLNSNQEAFADTNIDRNSFGHISQGSINRAPTDSTHHAIQTNSNTFTGKAEAVQNTWTGKSTGESSNTGTGKILSVGTGKILSVGTGTLSDSRKSSGSGWGSWFVKKFFNGNKSSLNKDGSIIDRLKYFDFDSSAAVRSKYYQAMGGTGTYDGTPAQDTWMISEMKKNGFKNGGTVGGLINKTGEDGLILARTGEVVLSEEKVRLLNEALNAFDPRDYSLETYASFVNPEVNNIRNNMIKQPEFTHNTETNQNRIDNVNIDINMPNIKNYEEFKNALIHDNHFEKAVQQMTLGNALGRNSLNKYRI